VFSLAALISLGESESYLRSANSRLSRIKQDEAHVQNYESGGQEFESLRARQ
jgi:hypothetical protein